MIFCTYMYRGSIFRH